MKDKIEQRPGEQDTVYKIERPSNAWQYVPGIVCTERPLDHRFRKITKYGSQRESETDHRHIDRV